MIEMGRALFICILKELSIGQKSTSKNKVKLEPYKTKMLKILKSQLASKFSEIRFSKWEKGMSNHRRRCDGKKLNNCSYDLREG